MTKHHNPGICAQCGGPTSRTYIKGCRPCSHPSLAERFWAKVDKSAGPEECWPWIGYRKRRYGYILVIEGGERRLIRAHRLALELSGTPIPVGMNALHSCDNPPCCNPTHLRVGTHSDNMRDRSDREPRQQACKHGHPFDAENTYWYRNHRECRACHRERQAQRQRAGLRWRRGIAAGFAVALPLVSALAGIRWDVVA